MTEKGLLTKGEYSQQDDPESLRQELKHLQALKHQRLVKKEYLANMKQPRVSRNMIKSSPQTSPAAVESKVESDEVKRLEAIEKELQREICQLSDQIVPKLFT